MNNIFSIFSNLEWGSVADWVSGFLTLVSLNYAFYLNLHRKKPNIDLELVNWKYLQNTGNDSKSKYVDSFYLLVQNEEQYSLNVKIKSWYNTKDETDKNWNDRIIQFPSINDCKGKPTYLVIPIELNNHKEIHFKFESLINGTKVKVTITKYDEKLVLYRNGIKKINQFVNENIKEGEIEKIK